MQQDLLALNAEINALLQGLSPTQTQATPHNRPGKWTIQQIVEHLLQTYRSSVSAIQVRVDKRSATRATPSLRQRLAQFVIITLGHFPNGREAPAMVCPPPNPTLLSGDDLAAQVTAELTRLDAVTREGEHVFGSGRAVSHIFLGPFSMQQWRRFHLIHGRHHLHQIRAIHRDDGF